MDQVKLVEAVPFLSLSVYILELMFGQDKWVPRFCVPISEPHCFFPTAHPNLAHWFRGVVGNLSPVLHAVCVLLGVVVHLRSSIKVCEAAILLARTQYRRGLYASAKVLLRRSVDVQAVVRWGGVVFELGGEG